MDKTAHRNYWEAIRQVSTVLGKSVDDIAAAIDEFYSRVTLRKVGTPSSDAKIETTVVAKPDLAPPILSGPSVVLEVSRRKPIEIGITSYRQLDIEKGVMADMTRVAVRRLEGTVAMPAAMQNRIRARF